MKAVRLHAPVGVEGLMYAEVPDAMPAFGDVLVRVHACGITPTELDWPIWTDRAGHERGYIIPVVQLNRAIALGHVAGPDVALKEVDTLADSLGPVLPVPCNAG